MRLFEHVSRACAILQRRRCQRDEARLVLRRLGEMAVDQAGPTLALLGRKLIAEHVEPAADGLARDLVGIEPLQPAGDVAERLRDRARRLVAGERKTETAAL